MPAEPLTGAALLTAAADKVQSWPRTSASRGRQVRWVAGEYGRALAHPGHPLDEGAGARVLFRREAVDAYLGLAARGELRVRKAADPMRYSEGTEHVRVQALAQLADALGVPAELPPRGKPAAKPPVPARPRGLLRASLTDIAERPGASAGQLRMLAIGATVADTAARAGELCTCTVEDLSPALEELRLVRRPQGTSEAETYVELVRLSALARAALRRWLPERAALLQRVGGSATALWVSLHANHHDGQPVPPGTPLRPRGLARAWTRAVATTNVEMAGEPGWTPLPGRMEQLRRGVAPKGVDAPGQPDAERASVLLDAVTARGAALAALRAQEEDGDEGTTEALAARLALRQALREAWAEGIEHAVQLSALAETGLHTNADLAAAGWEPVLLAAVRRAAGWGRAAKTEPAPAR